MSNDKKADMKYLLRAVRRLTLLFSTFFALISCGKNDRLSALIDNPEKLHPDEAAALQVWIDANGFDANDIHASESASHQGDVSILVSNARVRSIKAAGVSHLQELAALSGLMELNLSDLQCADLAGCPTTLERLRLRGTNLESLSGIEVCSDLRELEFFWTGVDDLAPLSGLKKLSRLTAERQTWETVTIPESLGSLTFLNLSHNGIRSISGLENLSNLEVLILEGNELTGIEGIPSLTKLKTLDLSGNQFSELASIGTSTSVEKINLKGNPLTDLSLLEKWTALKEVSSDTTAGPVPGDLAAKERLTDSQIQEQEARTLKASYLKNATFVEKPNLSSHGRTERVRKQITSRFRLNGKSEFKGSVEIGRLSGSVRLPIAETDSLEYQNKDIEVSGTVSIESGSLTIYSPVEIDFWQQAALFVDRPVRSGPVPDGLTLKGYLAHEISPGEPARFSAHLLPFGTRYTLLLDSGDGEVLNARFVLE